MLFRHDRAAVAVQAPSPEAAPVSASASDSGAPSGFVVERPPPGLARGKYPTSPLVIGALGTMLVLGVLLYYFIRFRKPRS